VKQELRAAIREDLDPKPRRPFDGGDLLRTDRRGEDDGVGSQIPVRPGILGVDDGRDRRRRRSAVGELPPARSAITAAGNRQDLLARP